MNITSIKKRIHTIVQQEGRRPRILLAHLERDRPDGWTKPLAAALAQFGFDVDISPAHPAPSQVARLAIDNDVHLVYVSLDDVVNQQLISELIEEFKAACGSDIRLVVGSEGVKPVHEDLYRAGVDLIVNFDKSNINQIDQLIDLIEVPSGQDKL
jgi:methylmalonyl-CoA mutase